MARWKSSKFKMTTGPESVSFDKLAEQMSQTTNYSKSEDPAQKTMDYLYSYLERPRVIEERSAHRVPGLHASSLHSTCARRDVLIEIALLVTGSEVEIVPEQHKAGSTFTQDLGHALHEWWQNKYLGPSGLLFGDWVCPRCEMLHTDTIQPDRCGPLCRGKPVYREKYVHIQDGLEIHGHCDGIVLDTPGLVSSKRRVFEIKTKSSTQYPTIHAPERKHVIQVHTYMRGLGLDEAIIIYVNKDKQCSWTVRGGQFIAGDPKVKAFLVPFDDDLWAEMESRVREYHDAMARIKAVHEGSVGPIKRVLNPNDFTRVCESIKCPMARRCPVKDLCFSV